MLPAHATQQISEGFIVDGKEHDISGKPLELLFKSEEIPALIGAEGMCSANWRGYVGTWELIESELYLRKLVIDPCSDPTEVSPVKLFGEVKYPVKAKWFTGPINVPLSDRVYIENKDENGAREHIGYEYQAIVYEFANGNLISHSEKKVVVKWK